MLEILYGRGGGEAWRGRRGPGGVADACCWMLAKSYATSALSAVMNGVQRKQVERENRSVVRTVLLYASDYARHHTLRHTYIEYKGHPQMWVHVTVHINTDAREYQDTY